MFLMISYKEITNAQIDKMNLDELKQYIESYGTILLRRIERIKAATESRERDEAYSRAWTFLKDANPSWNNDYVSHKANANHKYVSLSNKYLKAAEKASMLIDLCKAYESKEGILRTISANQRRQ